MYDANNLVKETDSPFEVKKREQEEILQWRKKLKDSEDLITQEVENVRYNIRNLAEKALKDEPQENISSNEMPIGQILKKDTKSIAEEVKDYLLLKVDEGKKSILPGIKTKSIKGLQSSHLIHIFRSNCNSPRNGEKGSFGSWLSY